MFSLPGSMEGRTLKLLHGTKPVFPTQKARTNIGSVVHYFKPMVKICMYHLYSLWLFTASDLKTVVGPSFVFGASNALAGAEYGLKSFDEPGKSDIMQRLPLVLLYIWMNLLPFTINNQNSPNAIKEDAINKRWRVLPSGRMTPQQAERLMLIAYPLAFGLSVVAGGMRQSVAFVFLGAWYNNYGGAEGSFFVRHLLNALGYVCLTSGAMEVALGFPLPVEARLVQWLCVIAVIVFSTIHLQDMYDQMGDSMRGRKTVPLMIGDGLARWTIAVPMIFWGYFCPHFWSSALIVRGLSVLLAGTVALGSLMLRTIKGDRLTCKIWSLWITLVFLLPLLNLMAR